jgi:hypothetical protein
MADLPQQYSTFYDTKQIQLGFLNSALPGWDATKFFSTTKAIEANWAVPKKEKVHNHMPDNDAYGTAFDLQVIYAICAGRIKRKAV